MAFIHSCMEYCSPLWAGTPVSEYPAQIDTVESKAFKMIVISCNEADFMGLSLSHHRKVGSLSVFYCLF